MLILVSAFSLIALVRELDSVGKGTYSASDAALYVLLTLPGWMVELAPAMALLGAIVGLGELAAGEELIVMQALSVSRARIAWSVLKTGLLVMLAVIGVQEFVAPKLNQLAFERRTQAISGVESTPGGDSGRAMANVWCMYAACFMAESPLKSKSISSTTTEDFVSWRGRRRPLFRIQIDGYFRTCVSKLFRKTRP